MDYIKRVIQPWYQKAPVTTCQILGGVGLYASSFLIPIESVLFHARLVNAGELYRIPFSLACLGTSAWQVIQRCLSLFYYQMPLEKQINEDHAGQTNFLTVQCYLMLSLVSMELLLFPDSNLTQQGYWSVLSPYALYPILEFANRWLWAMVSHPSQVMTIGLIRLEPIYVPLVMTLFQDSLFTCFKGLTCALLVGHLLQLKRYNGKPAVAWFVDYCQDWIDWFYQVSKA